MKEKGKNKPRYDRKVRETDTLTCSIVLLPTNCSKNKEMSWKARYSLYQNSKREGERNAKRYRQHDRVSSCAAMSIGAYREGQSVSLWSDSGVKTYSVCGLLFRF